MKKQELEITISPTGEVGFVLKGLKGKGCIAETQFLEQALGNAVIDREMTSEFYTNEGNENVYAATGDGDDER